MFNGSDNSLLASSRTMDPYGYDSDDEDHQDAKSDSMLGNDEGSNSKVSQTGSQLDKKYGIGAKLLSKMGYVEGRGLGRDGSGIANPIQVKPRTNASVGLGVLSDKRSRKFHTIDSSDDEQIPRPHNIVAFNKTTTESLTDNTESHERRNALKQRLSEIQVELDLQVSSELLRQVDSASLSEIEDLSAITRKLKDTQDDSVTLEHRIKALELQVRTLTDEERQLGEIAEELTSGEDLTLLDKAAKVLSLADSSLVDKLLAQLLRQFSLASPSANEQLVELVEVLQYQMEAATSQLNRTQTELHNLLFHCYLDQWRCFEVDKEPVSRMIFMLLDFEPVMKFINCFEYVKEKYVYPKLLSALESWNIVETGEFPPRLWMFDFFVIVDQSYRTKFKDIVESKVAEYFGTWYHRHSPLISRPDLIFIQELLGERYYEVLSDKFLPQFIEQLWDKHFDPLMELEDWKTTFVDEGSIFYARTLLKYRYYFDTAVFNTLLKAVFNEYNKILYQWLLYAPEEDGRKAKHWFYSIMNEIFRDTVLLDPELAQVRATFAFLDSSTLEPIHDESFDLAKQLSNLRTQKSGKGSSEEMACTIHNIPIRKVSASFKSVVEDFCLDNGFLMEKMPGKYAQLPNGIHGDTLVPVFKVSRGNTIYKLAISKDILWVERGKGNFSPTYLYELR